MIIGDENKQPHDVINSIKSLNHFPALILKLITIFGINLALFYF